MTWGVPSIDHLWYASVFSQTALIIILLRKRLAFRYPRFFLFLCFSVPASLRLHSLGRATIAYGYWWSGIQVIQVALLGLAVNEVISLLRASYPRFGAYGAWVMRWSWVYGVAAALFGVADVHRWLNPVFSAGFIRRFACTVFAVALLSLLPVFKLVKVVLHSNLKRHAALLGIYCTINSIGYWLLLGGYNRASTVLTLIGSTACYCGWSLLITRSGEARVQFYSEAQARRVEVEHDVLSRVLSDAVASAKSRKAG